MQLRCGVELDLDCKGMREIEKTVVPFIDGGQLCRNHGQEVRREAAGIRSSALDILYG